MMAITSLSRASAIFLGTFASEDGAFLASLALARQGVISLGWACAACGGGIFAGDLGLFWLGRAGRFSARRYGWMNRLVARARDRAPVRPRHARWAVFGARFVPGARLPVFVAAGFAQMPFGTFAGLTALAVVLWTCLGAFFAASILRHFSARAGWGAVAAALTLMWGAPPLLRSRAFRVWRYRRARWRHFEFWPMWAFYPPVVFYYIYLALRFGGVRFPLYANPGIPNGGVIGESKGFILSRLPESRPERLKFFTCHPSSASGEENSPRWLADMASAGLAFPVVVKPDVGQRGSGVRIVRNEDDLKSYFGGRAFDVIVQEFCPFPQEVGINYVRYPGQARGRITGITRKRFPEVIGDGTRALAELILDDPRARYMAPVYFARHARRLEDVFPAGQSFRLVEAGNHCQGAIFEDGVDLKTPDLEAAIDGIAREIPGFFVGRFDLRMDSVEDLRRGTGFKIIEINGGAGEATHIYDAKMPLRRAYRILFAQLRTLFEIGRLNQDDARPSDVLKSLWKYRHSSRSHPPTN